MEGAEAVTDAIWLFQRQLARKSSELSRTYNQRHVFAQRARVVPISPPIAPTPRTACFISPPANRDYDIRLRSAGDGFNPAAAASSTPLRTARATPGLRPSVPRFCAGARPSTYKVNTPTGYSSFSRNSAGIRGTYRTGIARNDEKRDLPGERDPDEPVVETGMGDGRWLRAPDHGFQKVKRHHFGEPENTGHQEDPLSKADGSGITHRGAPFPWRRRVGTRRCIRPRRRRESSTVSIRRRARPQPVRRGHPVRRFSI